MNVILTSSLLGVAAFLLQVFSTKEPPEVSVSVWPPGSKVYLGECALLQCSVESNSSFAWSYRWSKHEQRGANALTTSPRHLASGDSYSIAAVTREDAGSYRCRATRWESGANTSVELVSRPAALGVSELPAPSLLTLTPNTRQIFQGERFTVSCAASHTNSSRWALRRFSPGQNPVLDTDRCSPLGGAVGADESNACAFSAGGQNGGLYWCEGAEGRSNAVSITVSYGAVVLRTPAFPATEGDRVVLYCRYRTGNRGATTFFKNGAKIITRGSSGSYRVIKMTIDNVTREDEGSYKCASGAGGMESPESWLSVRPDPGNFTSADGTAASTSGHWKWIVVACGLVSLILIPTIVLLVRHYGYQMFCRRRCWAISKEDPPAEEFPATKQDVTEVQWDLSWMEMSTLLDKQLCPGT